MSGKRVAIHQPNYLPWVGYFHKIHVSDTFVFFDDVEYSSRSWINRNKIKTPDGWTWLTVPVRVSSVDRINEVEIDDNQPWQEEHRKSIQRNYGKADYFDEFKEVLFSAYEDDWRYLHELNIHLIKTVSEELGFECDFVRCSELDVEGSSTRLLINVCEELGADEYFSGEGGKDYMEENMFDERGVELTYQNIDHPEYPQRFDGFESHMSFVDMVFNIGTEEAYDTVDTL
jgi:hypothetical protein